MVFFTCSHCGESVKKSAVAKHYQTKCKKKEPFLTCVDCLKDFKGTDYEAHTKCITEDEKYSAKGYVPKPSQNKGEKKQQAWQECLQTVLKKPTLKPDERDLIRAVSKYENVPRKKAKFLNFLTNAFKQYANKNDLIDRVWAEMESVFKEMSANSNEEQKHREIKQPPQEQQKPQKQDVSKKQLKPDESAARKEKNRKRQAEEEKTADSSESGRPDEKMKKKKQKSNEENKVEGNTDMLISDITDESESKQEKKSRKRKADENCQTEQTNSVADEAEPGKKKKKKKHDKPTENQINDTPAQNTEVEMKSKKKNKKPKENADGKSSAGVAAPTGTSDVNAVKKEKKGKKSDNKENFGEKPVVQSTKGNAQDVAEKPAPKKKKPAKAEGGAGDEDKQESFDWKATILQVLSQDSKNNRIQLQKLQKKVLKLHCQILNCENSEKKEKKFMKKLKEIQQIEIDKDFVVLKS